MMIMVDNGNRYIYYWQGKYNCMGWLLNAYNGGRKPWAGLPWALDNGAFSAYKNNSPYDSNQFYKGLDKYLEMGVKADTWPMWVVVPDVVGNRSQTLKQWDEHAPRLQAMGLNLAFAAQDGMKPDEVPQEASVVFLGGTTDWKERAVLPWCSEHSRVHIGRVNGFRMLINSYHAGAESIDGTGWFRGGRDRWAPLENFIINQHKDCVPHPRPLFQGME